MSAECSRCGSDIVYPIGAWPVGECPSCDLLNLPRDLREIALDDRFSDEYFGMIVRAKYGDQLRREDAAVSGGAAEQEQTT